MKRKSFKANESDNIFANYFQQETSECYFLNEPFINLKRERISHLEYSEIDDSTVETSGSSTAQSSPFLADRIVIQQNEMLGLGNVQMSQLMKDLDFIDKPLAPRLKSKQSSSNEKCITVPVASKVNAFESSNSFNSDEQRRRKNKHQVKFLQSEYAKNSNWDRTFMKQLAK